MLNSEIDGLCVDYRNKSNCGVIVLKRLNTKQFGSKQQNTLFVFPFLFFSNYNFRMSLLHNQSVSLLHNHIHLRAQPKCRCCTTNISLLHNHSDLDARSNWPCWTTNLSLVHSHTHLRAQIKCSCYTTIVTLIHNP